MGYRLGPGIPLGDRPPPGHPAAVGLVERPVTRVGWALAALVSAGLAGASWWAAAVVDGRPVVNAVVAVLGLGYAWFASGAFRLARATTMVAVAPDRDAFVVQHTGLLTDVVVIGRDDVSEAHVDPRPYGERRIAAELRRSGLVAPTFFDPSLPVVSGAPSAHSSYGAAAPANVVVRLREPRRLPAPAGAVRFALRVSAGRSGRYQGPRPGRPVEGLRLVVDDVATLAALLDQWGVAAEAPRDRRYLAPITDRHRKRAARRRLAYGAIVVGGVLVVVFMAA